MRAAALYAFPNTRSRSFGQGCGVSGLSVELASAAADQPAYDIVAKGDDAARLVLAVPGYDDSRLDITEQDQVLTIAGRAAPKPVEAAEGEAARPAETLARDGILKGDFSLEFRLGQHVKVAGARLDQGLLAVDLVREVPEALKPKTVAIQRG